jgi:hypothetical protein
MVSRYTLESLISISTVLSGRRIGGSGALISASAAKMDEEAPKQY